ncbi:MAG: signal peptide peptidase SppA [Candidatus Tritonobacter lacicola]|nr:signal peptide peptidase SppA [Candidatus Tritonobacter lacicola]
MAEYLVAERRGRSVWFWLGIGALILVLLCSLGLNALLGVFLVSGDLLAPEMAEESAHVFRERLVGGQGRDKLLIIPLEGMISSGTSSGLWARQNTVSDIRARFKKAARDKNIKAILLVIDSPGGEITASDIIYNEILQIRKSGKKVIAELGDVAASGAYYCAAPCDFIIAHPTTITGSIGVIIKTANITGLYEKLGIEDVTIKSGPEKDILSPTRPMTDEERIILQAIINEMLDRFLLVVAEGRGLDESEIEEIAGGNIYTGEQALSLKLVDAIGYREDAIDKAKELLGVDKLKAVRYERVYTLKDILRVYSMRTLDGGVLSRLTETLNDEGTRFLYLWNP